MVDRNIFAIGNNAFRTEGRDLKLYRAILAATQKSRPKVCLIPTASGDAQDYMDAFNSTFGKLPCDLSYLSLFRGQEPNFSKLLLSQDLIYVSGGNTKNMLLLWEAWGITKILKEAYTQGVVMAGGSAGSLCWFHSGVTDSIPGRFSSLNCLNYLPHSNCPHYDELTRRPYYLQAVRSGELPAGYGAQNGVALHFKNEKFVEAISSKTGSFAFYVKQKEGNPSLDCEELEIPARVIL